MRAAFGDNKRNPNSRRESYSPHLCRDFTATTYTLYSIQSPKHEVTVRLSQFQRSVHVSTGKTVIRNFSVNDEENESNSTRTDERANDVWCTY